MYEVTRETSEAISFFAFSLSFLVFIVEILFLLDVWCVA